MIFKLIKPIYAAPWYGSVAPPPGVAAYGGTQGAGLIMLFNNLLKIAIGIAGLYALINFVTAGYGFLSAGGNDPKKIEESWSKIWQSLLGLLIAAGSFTLAGIFGKLIFNDWGAIINPQIYAP